MKRAAELPIRIVSSGPGSAEAVIVLDPDFAGFAGHFPGAPVLPGVCHIDLALRAASQVLGVALDLVAVDRARFVRRTLPGEELSIRLDFRQTEADVTKIAADHTVQGEQAAELRLSVTRTAQAPPPR